jgi:hypothetical protein
MKLLGHTSPRMTMRYVDVTLTDLQREFQLARFTPRHLAPQPKTSLAPLRKGPDGLITAVHPSPGNTWFRGILGLPHYPVQLPE